MTDATQRIEEFPLVAMFAIFNDEAGEATLRSYPRGYTDIMKEVSMGRDLPQRGDGAWEAILHPIGVREEDSVKIFVVHRGTLGGQLSVSHVFSGDRRTFSPYVRWEWLGAAADEDEALNW